MHLWGGVLRRHFWLHIVQIFLIPAWTLKRTAEFGGKKPNETLIMDQPCMEYGPTMVEAFKERIS